MNKKQLPTSLSTRELRWGLHYLVIQMLILGPFFSGVLPQLLSETGCDVDLWYYLINFAATFVIFYRFLLESTKYSAKHWLRFALSTIVGFIVCWLSQAVTEHIIQLVNPPLINHNNIAITEKLLQSRVVTILEVVILVPFAEEMIYRGLIFGGLHKRNRLLAYGISVLCFAAIHVAGYLQSQSLIDSLLTMITYIPAGLILAFAYEHSGSIFTPIMIHSLINLYVAIKQLLRS